MVQKRDKVVVVVEAAAAAKVVEVSKSGCSNSSALKGVASKRGADSG